MDGLLPAIDVRSVNIADALALHKLDYSFETDQIYSLRVNGKLAQNDDVTQTLDKPALAFELWETLVDPPLYKSFREYEHKLEEVETRLHSVEGGYVALAGGQIAGAVLLNVEQWRSVAKIEDIIVGRQFRRYGIGSLLLNCASDWARNRGCWAIVLETQNVNYPAIQFYLRNGLEVWSVHKHFYPPGPVEHEVAIFMGKKLR
ncbi:MAG: GNAT family N-acetyltransferase [Ktedonobacteraceae bacterium]